MLPLSGVSRKYPAGVEKLRNQEPEPSGHSLHVSDIGCLLSLDRRSFMGDRVHSHPSFAAACAGFPLGLSLDPVCFIYILSSMVLVRKGKSREVLGLTALTPAETRLFGKSF